MDDYLIEKRVYYHDTDCGGVVYYANYLKYLEEARTEFLRAKGIDLRELGEEGIFFVVARVEIDYKAPARYQDMLSIISRIEQVKYSTVRFFQEVKRDSVTVVEAKTVLVCVRNDFRPVSIPQGIKELIA